MFTRADFLNALNTDFPGADATIVAVGIVGDKKDRSDFFTQSVHLNVDSHDLVMAIVHLSKELAEAQPEYQPLYDAAKDFIRGSLVDVTKSGTN